MKWVNPGIAEAVDIHNGAKTQINTDSTKTHTGYEIKVPSSAPLYTKVPQLKEVWMSFDFRGSPQYDGRTILFRAYDNALNTVFFGLEVLYSTRQLTVHDKDGKVVYTSEKTLGINYDTLTNIEVHFKMGEEGRIDVWENTKLFCSYRSPTFFPDVGVDYIGLKGNWFNGTDYYVSSIIIQDTRRIGLEKFQKLTIDPDTEQNMPMGSTTTYNLSGLSDATEFSDITSVCAVLQATSRDANITTGTYSIEGADVGTIDVSDSSGKAYEIAHSEINSVTGKPWVRDDIEGKTLSFTVNGTAG